MTTMETTEVAAAARRRISSIAAHISPSEDFLSAPNLVLLPMNCSGNMKSVIRRCDNRMDFARQGSAYQAYFMRQVSREERSVPQCAAAPSRSSCIAKQSFNNASEGPLFARPATMEPIPIQPLGLDQTLSMPHPPSPRFSRPNQSKNEESKNKTCSKSESNVIEWSPRMDVAESGANYVVMVEIPGVSIGDIRVEVDDQNLMVTGQRTSQRWELAAGCSDDSISIYHKREILQGPYQVVWPLPTNANKDSISAEFLDGFLRIVIPKV